MMYFEGLFDKIIIGVKYHILMLTEIYSEYKDYKRSNLRR